MRYNRLRDLGLTEEQIKNNLLFSGEKVGDMMTTAMRPADAKAWFGAVPPDLSVIARAKVVGRRHRRRLPVHLPAHLLQGRHPPDRLEQHGGAERGDAARAVATAGRAQGQDGRRSRPARARQEPCTSSPVSSRCRRAS
jgi:cytochrome c1